MQALPQPKDADSAVTCCLNHNKTFTQLFAPVFNKRWAKAQPGPTELHGDAGLLLLYTDVCAANSTLYPAHMLTSAACFCICDGTPRHSCLCLCRTDRVRIHIDSGNKVIKTPKVG